MTDDVFAAIEGGALATLDGESSPQAEKIKQELALLRDSDVEAMKRVKLSPEKWAELFLAAIAIGKKLREVIRELRKQR